MGRRRKNQYSANHPPDRGDLTLRSSSNKSHKHEQKPPLSIITSQPDHKLTTLIDKLKNYQQSTQALKLLRKWEEDSILGGKDSSPFWNEFSQAISQLLWLPTKTEWQGLLNGCVKPMSAKSWFSTMMISAPNQSLLPISSLSCTATPVGLTPLGNTPTKLSISYKTTPRQKKTKVSPNKTLKIRVYPEGELHKVWKTWLAAARYCYNQAISKLKEDSNLSAVSLRNLVMNSALPEWVKNCPNNPRENAIFDAHDACIQAKKLHSEASYRSCRQPRQAIKFHTANFQGGRWYPWLTKKLVYHASESIPNACEFATQLVRDRKRWFAIFPQTVGEQKVLSVKAIALDPGVRTFLTGYDGESILEFGKADIGRIQRLCSHLDKLIEKAAKATRKQKQRMYQAANRLRIRIRHLVDECHKQTANYLTTNYKVIFLPTVETSQMVVKPKRKLNTKTARAMLSWASDRFKTFLKSLAARRDVVVVDVNESYTSKTCTACGFKHHKLSGSKKFKCPQCGHEHDRDWGSARNIFLRALRDGSFAISFSVDGIAIAYDLFVQKSTA